MSEPEKRTPLEITEAKRAERKASTQRALDAQLAIDLEAINELEAEHGDSNVAVIRVPFTATLPAAVACRCPNANESSRYRSRVKPKHEKDRPDHAKAAEEIAEVCLIYPTKELYTALCAARPGLAVQLGLQAWKLATGHEESEGKD